MKGIALTLVAVSLLACSDTDNDVKLLIDDLKISMALGYVSVLEADDRRIYAGTNNGIYISDDHGHSWHPTSFQENCTTITIDVPSVYAGTFSRGIFRSDDRGETWKPIRDGLRFSERDDGRRFYGTVRRILVTRDKIINVMYHGHTYTSTDWGETWHDVSEEWWRGNSIRSMTEFDGYLWSAISVQAMSRSLDNGKTWEGLPELKLGYADDWAVLNNRLYVAAEHGIGRWNEKTRAWEYLMEGIPTDNSRGPWVYNLAVLDGRLFAGLSTHGVYVFDAPAETWSCAGLNGLSVYPILSYESSLYAGTDGIYRARTFKGRLHAKVVTTWAHVIQ